MSARTNNGEKQMTQDKKALPETIIIDSSTLKLLLAEYKDNLSKINDWAVPLSIFVSLALALLASDFKSFSWVEGKQLQGATTTLAALSFLWFATAVIRQTKDNPMDALLSKIANNPKNIPEYTVLCFIKQTKNNIVKLLVMKNNNWNAYFLPYTPYNPNQTIHDQTNVVLNGIVARLGTAADDVVIESARTHATGSGLAFCLNNEQQGLVLNGKLESRRCLK